MPGSMTIDWYGFGRIETDDHYTWWLRNNHKVASMVRVAMWRLTMLVARGHVITITGGDGFNSGEVTIDGATFYPRRRKRAADGWVIEILDAKKSGNVVARLVTKADVNDFLVAWARAAKKRQQQQQKRTVSV